MEQGVDNRTLIFVTFLNRCGGFFVAGFSYCKNYKNTFCFKDNNVILALVTKTNIYEKIPIIDDANADGLAHFIGIQCHLSG